VRTNDVDPIMDLSETDNAEDDSDELFSGNDRVPRIMAVMAFFLSFFFLHDEFLDDEQKKEIRHRSNICQDTSVLSLSETPLSLLDYSPSMM